MSVGSSTLIALSTVVACAGAAAAQPSATPARQACDALASRAIEAGRVTGARVVEKGAFVPPAPGGRTDTSLIAGLPPFCRVELELRPTTASRIGVEVWLPLDGWNGRFQAVGNGGWSGSISYPALARAVSRGYAAASTDTGHKGDRATFALGPREQLDDFAWRAVHLTAVEGKAAVAAFYGSAARFSYWNGCSSGGRQGLKEAQRFPADFDGIIAGAPASNWVNQKVAHVMLQQDVNRDAAAQIPATKYAAVHRAVLAACDAIDRVSDGVLEDPRTCRFDPAVLACTGTDTPDCLTPAQVATARRILAPTVDPRTGAEIFPGVLPGAEASWDVPAGPEPRATQLDLLTYVVFRDPAWDYRSFDVARDYPRALQADAEGSTTAATNPDISPFVTRGGKLLMYHGWADPNIMAMNTVNYYAAVTKAVGEAAARDAVRLFMVPGMGHCSGGDGTDTFDMVTALEQWVEGGQAPTRIVASRVRSGVTQRTRPLCAFPQVARYTGSGSSDDERNFVCAVP